MTEEQWREAWEILQKAQSLPPEDRRSLLMTASLDREVIEQLIEADEASGLWSRPSESERSSPTFAGARVGRFEVVAFVCRGGMGEVWAARDPELNRRVALKFLPPERMSGHAAELFLREARAASALNHPNIVTVYEVIYHEAAPVIVMELVEGVALRVESGTPQPQERVVHIGLQIAQALSAAHAAGIVHRDIKPENVLVRPDGYVKVLDFGLARHVFSETLSSSAGLPAGTLRYMSPEQARGEPPTEATDIFSLGLVLYELLTGRHPFAADSPLATAHAITSREPAALSAANRQISSSFERLILAMLAKDQTARPSATQVAKILAERPEQPPRRRGTWLAVVAGSIVLTVVAGRALFQKPGSQDSTELRIRPLTSQVGWENNPALSPDGQSIAFTWTDDLDRSRQIYVKRLSDSEPVRLTSSEEGIIGPLVWSPDGARIVFKRWYGQRGAIYSIPSTGGDEERIVELTDAALSSAIDWSPDGKQLIFSDMAPDTKALAIYLFNLQTGEKKRLTSPSSEDWGDWDPRFSPDGRTVAFKRVAAFWLDDIYTIPTTGGALRKVTADGRGIWGHTWTPDGRSLIVSCQRGGTLYGLWRFPVSGQGRPERVTSGSVDAVTPAMCLKTGGLSWVNHLEDLNIYRAPMTGTGTPDRLIASTLRDLGPSYSPDGRLAFISDRSGTREIWIAKADGSGQVRVTNFQGPSVARVRWSPDGRRIAFDGQFYGRSDVFWMECAPPRLQCAEAKRLTSEKSSEESPSWSADGESLYFASNRTGRWQVWKQPIAGGKAMQITHNDGYMAFESSDGRWLYFSNARKGILRMAGSKPDEAARGSSEKVVISRRPSYDVLATGWTMTDGEIVFFERTSNARSAAIRVHNIASGQTRTIVTVKPFLADMTLSVSPDSHWILYPQLDRSGSNIMVADELR